MPEDNERDERINDLLGFAVDKKPSEFQQAFNDILIDRIAQAVDTRKQEMANGIFNDPPEEPEEDPVEIDEPEEEEQDPDVEDA